VNLLWKPPLQENGIIESYYIYYASIKDLEPFPNNLDHCQSSSEIVSGKSREINQNIKMHQLQRNLKINCNQFSVNDPEFKTKSSNSKRNKLIAVEDEIYNLAFKPAKIQRFINKTLKNISRNTTKNSPGKTIFPVSNNKNVLNSKNFTEQLKQLFSFESSIHETYINHANLIKISNTTLNFTLYNLKSFGRYLVSIVACQNIEFSVEDSCSKPTSFTFRSLPDAYLDVVKDTFITEENNIFYYNWAKPLTTNGFILKYNLKFIDIALNKTHGIFCQTMSENTLNSSFYKISLSQFLLNSGHEYFIQIQPTTIAGDGIWSTAVKYKVSNDSIKYKFYLLCITLLILLIFIASYLLFKKFTVNNNKNFFRTTGNYYYFSPDEWEISRENVIIGERIGSGCFAEVHKGKVKLKNNEEVDCAIKFCGSDEQSRQRILKEGNMMKSIDTTHIVKLLAIISKNNPAYLILEYMDKGDLKEYLKFFKMENRKHDLKQEISEHRFYRIAGEIADGMLYLAEHKYVHRDLAARNCLISKNDVIKIADLGLSKDIYKNPVYREKCKSLLPIRWMSPESLIDGSSTTKSDVWSYCVVLYELCTYGDNPYNEIKDNEQVIKFVSNGGKLKIEKAPIKFFTILNKCLIKEDYKRLGFKEILDILDPDLPNDFKQTSYYHNQYRKNLLKKIDCSQINDNSNTFLRKSIVNESDNYM